MMQIGIKALLSHEWYVSIGRGDGISKSYHTHDVSS